MTKGLIRLECNGIASDDVRRVFNRTHSTEVNKLLLKLNESDEIIPADLIGNKRITSIELECPSSIDYQVSIDPRAFRSSRNETDFLYIAHCNLSRLDFAFLSGFDHLYALRVAYSSGLHLSLPSLPALPSLSDLAIDTDSGLKELKRFPTLFKGLDHLALGGNNDLDDESFSRILEWVLNSSRNSLYALFLISNPLTIIPRQFSSFTNLTYLTIFDNAKPLTIKADSFHSWDGKMEQLELTFSPVSLIEPDAFKG